MPRIAPRRTTLLTDRIAGAPISWGVSETPGWGHQLTADRVLGDMRDLGLAATEFGPDGFLPTDPAEKVTTLNGFGLRSVGGFLPVLMHDAGHDPLPEADLFIDALIVSEASVVVLAAYSGADGYDDRPVLDEAQWMTMLDNLDRLSDHADSRGVVAAIHPHIGTMVQTAAEVDRVLAQSHVGLCVDTGHLMVGGADPVAIVEAYTDRVVHMHLKDVDAQMADRVLTGGLPFGDAVAAGLFRPLGQGDVAIDTMISTLEASGYTGWYVLEQDLRLSEDPVGDGPYADVRTSLDFLLAVGT